MKTLDQVDYTKVFEGELQTPVHIVSGRPINNHEVDLVFSRPLSPDEATLFLFRVYHQISGEYPCTIKSGSSYSIELKNQDRQAIFADQLLPLNPLAERSIHHRLKLQRGNITLAEPLFL